MSDDKLEQTLKAYRRRVIKLRDPAMRELLHDLGEIVAELLARHQDTAEFTEKVLSTFRPLSHEDVVKFLGGDEPSRESARTSREDRGYR